MIRSHAQVSLSQARLNDIRHDVRAKASTWADLCQEYPPAKSCFEPLNFAVSSWSAIATEDATGLGDDIDADEAYSQAATLAAYGVDILSSAVVEPKVDRELVLQASGLFATLCATLIDTRDRHRDSVNKAVAEKIGAFGRILDKLDNSPPVGDASCPPTIIEKIEPPIDSGKAPGLATAEQQETPKPLHNELGTGGSSPSGRWHPYNRSRPRSPDFRQKLLPRKSRNYSTAENDWPVSLLKRHLEDIRSSASSSATAESSSREGERRPCRPSNRSTAIRTALLKHGFSEPAITKYFHRYSKSSNKCFDRIWSIWVNWCGRRGKDPYEKSEGNMVAMLLEYPKDARHSLRLDSALNSVWLAIDGDTRSSGLKDSYRKTG